MVGTTDFVKQRVRGLRCTGNSFEGLEERWAVYQVLPNSSLICIHQRLGMLNTTLPNLLTMMDGPGIHSWPTNKSVYDKGFWEGLSLKHHGQYSSLPWRFKERPSRKWVLLCTKSGREEAFPKFGMGRGALRTKGVTWPYAPTHTLASSVDWDQTRSQSTISKARRMDWIRTFKLLK